ncbi:MAG TPA: enoyl-CoA hydratase/isomerase family protein [Rhizomicrobium sp.]|nr:enoyl-CoA hydratase/isomerase family protein [Rhizomicrobium sp.]
MSKSQKIGHFITIVRDGAVATVTLDRGDGLNAMSLEVLQDLKRAAESFADDLETQAVVMTGKGAFTAGADLKDPALAERGQMGLLERRHVLKAGPDACDAWEKMEQITIAAVEGYCIGGGVALAAACDFRVAARSAYFRLPEIPLGMNMSWHTIPRLVALIGPAQAKKFVLFGEKLAAQDAAAQGFADEIAADGEALAKARDWAARVAKLPPNAVRMTKQSVNAAANALHAATTFMDRDQFLLAASSEDYREAIAAFLEKRPPRFTGR